MARSVFHLLLFALVASVTASEPRGMTRETAPGDYVKRVDVDGRTREYRLHVPAHYDGTRRLPVIFAFHGSSASASVIERETSFDERGDSLDFFAVYPEGLHRAWNIGECCRYSFTHHIDEQAFVTAILAQMNAELAVDSTRIYLTGYSDGATLSYLLACAMPRRIAAIAGISGTLFAPAPACPLPRPIPVMVVHGTADTQIPYAGSKTGSRPEVKGDHYTHSAADVTRFWVERDECRMPPDSVQSGNVIRLSYDCPDSTEVVFYTILGGKHGWPGGGRGWIFSPVPPKDMIASDTVARFFLRHHLPS